jgi:hypothetical protein
LNAGTLTLTPHPKERKYYHHAMSAPMWRWEIVGQVQRNGFENVCRPLSVSNIYICTQVTRRQVWTQEPIMCGSIIGLQVVTRNSRRAKWTENWNRLGKECVCVCVRVWHGQRLVMAMTRLKSILALSQWFYVVQSGSAFERI